MEIKKRQIGNSDLYITPIAFGAWAIGGWMWGGTEVKEAVEAVRTSVSEGVTTIDTAPVYGFGLSEEIVGEAIKGNRQNVEILTKYGLVWNSEKGDFYFSTQDADGNELNIYRYASKNSIIRECENSLKRLGTDYIDLYQIHWPNNTNAASEIMEALSELHKSGKIRAAGVSNYNKSQLAELKEISNIVSNQVSYSMVSRSIENQLVPYCQSENIGILAYSPLQRGLLTGKYKKGHSFKPGDHRPGTPYFKDSNLEKMEILFATLEELAKSKNSSLAQVVLAWTINQPGITCALAGARSKEQVLDNLGALRIKLYEDEIMRINQVLNNLNLDL